MSKIDSYIISYRETNERVIGTPAFRSAKGAEAFVKEGHPNINAYKGDMKIIRESDGLVVSYV